MDTRATRRSRAEKRPAAMPAELSRHRRAGCESTHPRDEPQRVLTHGAPRRLAAGTALGGAQHWTFVRYSFAFLHSKSAPAPVSSLGWAQHAGWAQLGRSTAASLSISAEMCSPECRTPRCAATAASRRKQQPSRRRQRLARRACCAAVGRPARGVAPCGFRRRPALRRSPRAQRRRAVRPAAGPRREATPGHGLRGGCAGIFWRAPLRSPRPCCGGRRCA